MITQRSYRSLQYLLLSLFSSLSTLHPHWPYFWFSEYNRILYCKNTITEMRNTREGVNSRLPEVEETISEMENREQENNGKD